MHTGPARRENPAAPALFLRGGLMILRLAIYLSAVSALLPGAKAALQGVGDTQYDTPPGAPPRDTLSPSIGLLDFFTAPAPIDGAMGDRPCNYLSTYAPEPLSPAD